MPMCESTMHGVTNFMSIGYGFHDPCWPSKSPFMPMSFFTETGAFLPPAFASALAMSCHPSPGLRICFDTNSTKLGTPHPFANVPVCVNGACARSSKFSINKPCSTGTHSMMSSACVVYPSGGRNVTGSDADGRHVPGHTMISPSCTPIGRNRPGVSKDSHTNMSGVAARAVGEGTPS
jgi:hypothetical protein